MPRRVKNHNEEKECSDCLTPLHVGEYVWQQWRGTTKGHAGGNSDWYCLDCAEKRGWEKKERPLLTKAKLIDTLAKKADKELRELLDLWLSDEDVYPDVLEEGTNTLNIQVVYTTNNGGEVSDSSFMAEVDPNQE